MPRYIDADALMDFLTIIPIDLGYREIDDVKEYVKRLPAADVAPVRHGEWEDKDGGIATCSVCGTRWGVWDVMNYCPQCGAKMEVEHE